MLTRKTIYLGGLKTDIVKLNDLLNYLENLFSDKSKLKPLSIISANLQHIGIYSFDGKYPENFDVTNPKVDELVLIDGKPLQVKASKILGEQVEKLSGSDLLPKILDIVLKNKHKIAFIGGNQELTNQMKNFLKKYPNAEVYYYTPTRAELLDEKFMEKLAKKIKKDKVTYLNLNLPKPISDNILRSYSLDMGIKLGTAFGAAAEFMVGIKKRSPKVFTLIGAEWLWRLLSEPKRLFRRYLIEGPGEYLQLKYHSGRDKDFATPELWRKRIARTLLFFDILNLTIFSILAAYLRTIFPLFFRGYSISWYTVFSAVPIFIIFQGWLKGRLPNSPRIEIELYLNYLYGTLVGASAMGLISFLLRLETSRGYLLLLTFFSCLSGVLTRGLVSNYLTTARKNGRYMINLLHSPNKGELNAILKTFVSNPEFGYRVFQDKVNQENLLRYQAGIVYLSEEETSEIKLIEDNIDSKTEVLLQPKVRRVAPHRYASETIKSTTLFHLLPANFTGWRAYTKEGMDILCSFMLILILSPILAIISILIYLEDRHSPFFKQVRVGRGEKNFTLYKFRTMVPDAERILENLKRTQSDNLLPNDILFKMKDDPRVTRVGKFLRKWSLDELPQLFNVLNGEMSLVGPRPALPNEVALYPEESYIRHYVTPGVTGLWQVSGRSNLDSLEALNLDLHYVLNWSIYQDILIILKTFKAVIKRDGAY